MAATGEPSLHGNTTAPRKLQSQNNIVNENNFTYEASMPLDQQCGEKS
jgi:hypothetical protein